MAFLFLVPAHGTEPDDSNLITVNYNIVAVDWRHEP